MDTEFTPKSKALRAILHSIDETFLNYEETISHLKIQRDQLQSDYNKLITQQVTDGNKMIADVLKACLTEPPLDVLNAAGSIIVMKIADMQTIEEVHEYIHTMKQNTKLENHENS